MPSERTGFDFEYYLQLADQFAYDHPSLAHNNSQIEKMISVLLGEWQEVWEAFQKCGMSFAVPSFELMSELADVTFGVALRGVLHLPVDFNYSKSSGYVSKQPPDENFFANMNVAFQQLNKPKKADQAMWKILGGLETISLKLPASVSLTAQVKHTDEKNRRNYPERVFSGKDPWTEKALSRSEMQAQYDHGAPSCKVIRIAAGRPRDGMDPLHWQPFLPHLDNFREPNRAQSQLRRDVSKAIQNGYFESNRVYH